MATAADDPESRKRLFALLQGLQQLGWVEGRNLRVDIRCALPGVQPSAPLSSRSALPAADAKAGSTGRRERRLLTPAFRGMTLNLSGQRRRVGP